MRICLTSDWHIDATTAGRPRLRELHSYIDRVVAGGPYDWVFFLGDAADPGGRLAARYGYEMIKAAGRLHEVASKGSVWIAGNHDVIETDEAFTTLSPLRAHAEVVSGMHVYERPAFVELSDAFGLMVLPYVSRAFEMTDEYHASIGEAYGAAAEHRDRGSAAWRGVIGHLSVPGAAMGSESEEMARGRDVDFPRMDIARIEPTFVANGHYHFPQVVKGGGLEIIIPGSPMRFTFGERESSHKGYAVIEVDR